MKPLLISISLFLLLGATAAFLGFMYLTDQTPGTAIANLHDESRLILYKYGMVDRLAPSEVTRLYRSTCTRQCHGKDVIENKSRTAAEWEAVISRMKAPDRANISDRHAETITRYLQNNFLSNVPTVLPEKTMKFVKQYLWRSDFGESDLFLDIIYVPREHLSLLRYLLVRNPPNLQQKEIFVVFINTHQGTVPPWKLAEMSTLRINDGPPQKSTGWGVLYRDGQEHHNQGILSFPPLDANQPAKLEITMQLAGLGTRTFQWNLPVPPLPE